MEDKELSQWFDINVQKPWEPGVYSVEDEWGSFWYMKWDGIRFMQNMETVEAAANQNSLTIHTVCPIRWRGLASDPSAKPKPKTKGNRKVTRYVCVYGVFNNPCAVFNTKKEAEKHVNSGKSWSYTKIRFRTPEA